MTTFFQCLFVIYQIIAIILHKSYLPKDRFEVLAPAEEYIVSHFDKENINIPFLAGICGLSESYFKTLFVSKHGLTPKKHITLLKIERAKSLLLSEIASVSNVAEMTGYENAFYFSSVFKRETGLIPSEYAKKYTTTRIQYSPKESSALFDFAMSNERNG